MTHYPDDFTSSETALQSKKNIAGVTTALEVSNVALLSSSLFNGTYNCCNKLWQKPIIFDISVFSYLACLPPSKMPYWKGQGFSEKSEYYISLISFYQCICIKKHVKFFSYVYSRKFFILQQFIQSSNTITKTWLML